MAASAKRIGESSAEALKALISSLSPEDSNQHEKLSEEQISHLTERLDLLLGQWDGDSTSPNRNERGELVNEEGLPIIDITEPVETDIQPDPAIPNEALFLHDGDPPPLSRLTRDQRESLNARRDRILDQLEAEEERERLKEAGKERREMLEEYEKRYAFASSDKERRLATKELQKKMGKALMKDFMSSRGKQDILNAAGSAASTPVDDDDILKSPKTKKTVSFAEDVKSSESSSAQSKRALVQLGDVSVAASNVGVPRARLKSEEIKRQPMRLEVIERVHGMKQADERDSDDESSPEEVEDTLSDDDFSHSESEGSDLDLSQAQLRREVALEYIKLRDSIGSEAKAVLESEYEGGEHEWDRPVVPVEATLASKPPKPNVSRFKQDRQTETSISLAASVLPEGQAHILKRAVRVGKLNEGRLMGGFEGESESDLEESESKRKALEVLKTGNFSPTDRLGWSEENDREPSSSGGIRESSTQTKENSSKRKGHISRFKGEALATNGDKFKPAQWSKPSSVLNTVVERKSSLQGAQSSSDAKVKNISNISSSSQTTFKNIPTPVTVPSRQAAAKTAIVKQSTSLPITVDLNKPTPSVLQTMIVDSPSFPPPSSYLKAGSPQSAVSTVPRPLVDDVREFSSDRHSAAVSSQSSPAPPPKNEGRISRFKAQRMLE